MKVLGCFLAITLIILLASPVFAEGDERIPAFFMISDLADIREKVMVLDSLYILNVLRLTPEQSSAILKAIEPLERMHPRIVEAFKSAGDIEKMGAASINQLSSGKLPAANHARQMQNFIKDLTSRFLVQYNEMYRDAVDELMDILTDEQKRLCVILSHELLLLLEMPLYSVKDALQMTPGEFSSRRLEIARQVSDFVLAIDDEIDTTTLRRELLNAIEGARNRLRSQGGRGNPDAEVFQLVNQLIISLFRDEIFDDAVVEACVSAIFTAPHSYQSIRQIHSSR